MSTTTKHFVSIDRSIFDYEKQGCLHEIFRRRVATNPDDVILVAPKSDDENGIESTTTTTRKLTSGELDSKVQLLSKYLRAKCGVIADDCVGIYMEKCPQYVIAYVAILTAGGGYMPLDLSYPKSLLDSIVDEARPKAICTKAGLAYMFANDKIPLIIFDDDWEQRLENELRSIDLTRINDEAKVTLDNLAYLVYSSGTTGKPKGMRCPHRGAVFSYHWRHLTYPFSADDRVACNVFFVWEMLRPILKGIPMYIIPDDIIYDPALLCRYLARHRITQVLFTPSLFEAVLGTQTAPILEEAFRSMRQIWLCGEVVTVTLLRRATQLLPHVQLMNLYSISECHDVAVLDLSAWFKDFADSLNDPTTARKFAPVGKLLPGVKVAIMNEQLQPQPIGMSGEIFVGGPCLALGYVNRPDINAKKFLTTPSHLVAQFGPRLYRTGDWGYLLADGDLEICGRCDSMVKVRGYSVEIQAIEVALLNIEGVSAGVVVVKGEEGEDKHLVAYVVVSNRSGLTRKLIRNSLKGKLPFYMVPSYFVILPQLPLLPASSKVDKKSLPHVDPVRDVIEPEALPSTPTETALAKLWADVLGLCTVDVHDSFFDLGGHSLLATKLLNLLKAEFNVALSVRELFSEPTVAGLAGLLDRRGLDPRADVCVKPTMDLAAEVERYDSKHSAMDLHLRAFWRSLRWSDRWNQGCVLLTGATGYLGSFLLREILRTTRLRVVCLVRETSEVSVETRLLRALKEIGVNDESTRREFKNRVLVFKGDVALNSLGLSEDDYHFLTFDVDFVFHAAAYVNLVYPYLALRSCNVIGTQNILTFCYANKIKPLHYISTDGIFPHGLENCGEESNVDELWPKLTDGYSQSKWVGEQLVLRARQRGLPTVIYRLGNQAGDSKTGIWNPQDFTYFMLYGCAYVGAVPELNWQMEMTPVDFTAETILDMSTTHFIKSAGKIFHLINTDAPSSTEVFSWLEEQTRGHHHGQRLEPVSFEEWTKRIRTHLESYQNGDGQLKSLERLLDCMIKDASYFTALTTYSRANTDAFLTQIGRKYPVIDSTYVRDSIKHLLNSGRLPRPKGIAAKPLCNRTCVVTGASSGIGEAIARILAIDGGAKVAMLARRTDQLEDVRRSIEEGGGHAVCIPCDVTDRDQVLEAIRQTEDAFGRSVDIVVNNAGVMHYTFMKNVRHDEWQQEIDVNVTGTMNVLAACLKSMVERRSGHIVNITSDAGRKPFPGLAVYSGTKFFIEAMSGALRQEMVEYNVKVTNIQPGDVATELLTHTSDPEARAQFIGNGGSDSTEKPKVLDPTDIAKAVFYAVTSPPHCAINEILIEPRHAPI